MVRPVVMKLNTEIIQKNFIVTCEGERLDPSFAQTFLNSMQEFIRKGRMNIVLDLLKVKRVDSTGLGAIVRFLKEINSHGQLVLCGVDEMVLSLLNITHIAPEFIEAADRDDALKKLGGRQKKPGVVAATPVQEAPSAPPKLQGFDASLLDSLQMEDAETAQEDDSGERRKFRRITHKQIISEDIVAYCTNSSTGIRTKAIVLDISPGGILVAPASELPAKNKFLIEGHIGKNFKYRENAVIRNCREGKYGLEFIKPSQKTISFLQQLTGAVVLTRGQVY